MYVFVLHQETAIYSVAASQSYEELGALVAAHQRSVAPGSAW
jgi:hypothetical protein